MPTRNDVVTKAREYVNTPFQHQGRMKGKSCDCIGLPLLVAEELGLKDMHGVPIHGFDVRDYSAIPTDAKIKEGCDARLPSKPVKDIKPGDVVLMRFTGVPCHSAIITEIPGQGLGVIHAYNPAGKVVEHILSKDFRDRIVAAYTWLGVMD